jgi:hypothetical protein
MLTALGIPLTNPGRLDERPLLEVMRHLRDEEVTNTTSRQRGPV